MLFLYENIKRLREQKGMSQDELAELTGYTSRSSIAKIEKGLVDLQQSKILAFAKALHVTPSELMGWEDSESLCGMTTFEDEIDDYTQEIGEFLYYNQGHKVLFDSIMNVKSSDVELAKQMLDRINGIHIIPFTEELNAAHSYTDTEIPEVTDTSDNTIMDDENF